MSRGEEVVALFVAVGALIGVVSWLVHWYVLDFRYWRLPSWRHRIPNPGLVYEADTITTTTGEIMTTEEWEQLDPDTAADTLIAEWHHEPMEHKADTDTMGLMDDAELLLWDIRRQHALIQALRGRWRVEMAGLDAWYRAELEHRRAAA